MRISSCLMKMNFDLVVKKLNEFAPLSLAQSWDNVGVLVQPPQLKEVSKILLTNDLTLEVMDEAEEKNIDLILTYHPLVFKPLKAITLAHWKERIVGRCLAKGIGVHSPHTSYDSLQGGVNDWLISAFGEGRVSPIHHETKSPVFSHRIEIATEVSLQSEFVASLRTNGVSEDDFLTVNHGSSNFAVLCKERVLPGVCDILSNYHPNMKFFISKCEKVPLLNTGDGRKVQLTSSLTLEAAIESVKTHLKLSKVRVAVKYGGTLRDFVTSVAVCAGAGSSVLRGVNADLFLTGEMSHHDVLEKTQTGSSVILVDHSNSERGFLFDVLRPKLNSLLDSGLDVSVSSKDADPLSIY